MISWSQKKKITYIGSFFIFVILFVLVVALLALSRTKGSACGGAPGSVCPTAAVAAKDPIVYWTRLFPDGPGLYNVLAYVDNPNPDLGVPAMAYRFKLYDSEDILVAERDGETPVPPDKTFAIFEGGIPAGTRFPVRALFEFGGVPLWQEMPAEPVLLTSNMALSNGPAPRLDAILRNSDSAPAANIEAVAIVYGTDGNALSASRTVVPYLDPGSSQPIFFTWRVPFGSAVGRIEILSRTVRGF